MKPIVVQQAAVEWDGDPLIAGWDQLYSHFVI